ncbi:MAG: DUF4424 family protein [Paracoccus sp. (in: a-proteobacteria)]|nr:DUF4424 family protein [Paracoccus sp. (in: a-proteobacteria)]
MMLRAAVVAALTTAPAWANDSEAGLSAGGLVLELRQNDRIEMQSEVLRISPDRVQVDYVFLNHGSDDQTITVAFPLPDLSISPELPVGYYQGWQEDKDSLEFHITVDGRPVTPQAQRRAVLAGRDVTDRVTAAGLPLNPMLAAAMADNGVLLTPHQRALMPDGQPDWALETVYHWQQTFPAGHPLRVSHDYRPISGGAIIVPGQIDANDPSWAQFCPEGDFIAGADRLIGGPDGGYGFARMVGYVLKTGANWRGPIGVFPADRGKAFHGFAGILLR